LPPACPPALPAGLLIGLVERAAHHRAAGATQCSENLVRRHLADQQEQRCITGLQRSRGSSHEVVADAEIASLALSAPEAAPIPATIDGHNQLPKLIQGVKFADGIEVIGNSAASQAQAAA